MPLAVLSGYASADTDRGESNSDEIGKNTNTGLCIDLGIIDIGCDDDDEDEGSDGDERDDRNEGTPTPRTEPYPEQPSSPTETKTQTTIETESPPLETKARTRTEPAATPTPEPERTRDTAATPTPRQIPQSPQGREPPETSATKPSITISVTESTTSPVGTDTPPRTSASPRSTQTTVATRPSDTEPGSKTSPPITRHETETEIITNASAGGPHRTASHHDHEERGGGLPFDRRPLLAGLGLAGVALLAMKTGPSILRTTSRDMIGPIGHQLRSGYARARRRLHLVLDWLIDVIGQLWWIALGSHTTDEYRLLEHDTRRSVFKVILDSPGQPLTTVARETDIPRISIEHHARVLVSSGALTDEKQSDGRRYYPTTDVRASDVVHKLIAVEEHPARAIVLTTISEADKEITPTEIAEMINHDKSTLLHHLNRLETNGLIERDFEKPISSISLHEDDADIINQFMQ